MPMPRGVRTRSPRRSCGSRRRLRRGSRSVRWPPRRGGGRGRRGPATRGAARRGASRAAPLAPLLAAFDGAFAPAGYNMAHELAKARVPAALFAQPRAFDDQAARAGRFAAAGFARALGTTTDDAIAGALAWMGSARVAEV